MIILDRVSNVSKNILFALSNYEASRVGRFLCNVYALFHSFCNPKVGWSVRERERDASFVFFLSVTLSLF